MNLDHTQPADKWTSRLYETEADLLHMQGLLMEGRSQTNDWHYPHIGDLNFWFFMVACHLSPQEFIRLWQDDESKLVAYAILGEDPTFECQVLPEYEGCGIEAEALAWAESRLTELIQQDAQRWGGRLISGARQDDAKRISFLEAHGFQRGEYAEVNMICALDGVIPEAVVPVGCLVRSFAGESELSNRADAQREVWRPWTVGNVSDDDYAALMTLPGYDRQLDVVAVAADGVIAAYVNGWIDSVNQVGDFGPVGALPAYRRQGLTKAVLLECMARMKKRGMNRVSVSTGVSNDPGLRLYESAGFKIVNEYHEYGKA
jgi:ribosomal protein S18 acetylase RimI-like enzyme